MTIITQSIVTPLPGKAALAISRVQRMVANITRLGVAARVFKVVMGDGVGSLVLLGRYPDFASVTRAAVAMSKDPAIIALNAERENEQAAVVTGPYVYRSVFGEVSTQPVLLVREYQISRKTLKDAIALLPEAKAATDPKSGMLALVPLIASEMDRLVVSYYADSIEDLGEKMDKYGLSEAFAAAATKASHHGTVVRSSAMAVI